MSDELKRTQNEVNAVYFKILYYVCRLREKKTSLSLKIHILWTEIQTREFRNTNQQGRQLVCSSLLTHVPMRPGVSPKKSFLRCCL